MKTGISINELAARITHERSAKRDFIADTRKVEMNPGGYINFLARPRAGGDMVKVGFLPTQLAIRQIGARVGIPASYVDRMKTEAPELLATNVNHWFAQKPEVRMLRTLDNDTCILRAFLSEAYRSLDNADLAEYVLPKLAAAGCEIKSCQITEERLYIQAVTPKLEAIIEQRRKERTQHVIGEVNDIVQAGICISNSEVGCGALKVEPLIYRLVCRNGAIMGGVMNKYHVGRNQSQGDEFEGAREFFTDSTRKADDHAFWLKVGDVVDGALNEAVFRRNVESMNRAKDSDLGNPVEVVEKTVDRFTLNEHEGKSVLEHLTRGGDLSLFGLANAVTRTAEDVKSYDRAIELERIGGGIFEMPPQNFAAN